MIAIVAISTAYWGLLVWQHLHGGVQGHSFLARADMPRISNWWGALLLPLLTFLLTGAMLARLESAVAAGQQITRPAHAMMLAFLGALAYGLALIASVATGRSEVSWLLFRSLPLVALLWPVYRAEYVLGFVLALTYSFGAVLPTVIAGVVAGMSFVLHLTLRRGLRALLARRRRDLSASRAK